jgi:putative phage-type endonuclease
MVRVRGDWNGYWFSGPVWDDCVPHLLDAFVTEIQLVQGSQEWLDFRRTKRMASETPAIMGLSPWQKPKDILKAKKGEDAKANYAMRRGQELEPVARDVYQGVVGLLRPAVFVAGDYGASLDGIDLFNELIVEIKCPMKGKASELWKQAENGEIPSHYAMQMQHQMMVTGIPVAHLWVFDGKEGIAVPLNADEQKFVDILSAWDSFWSENFE